MLRNAKLMIKNENGATFHGFFLVKHYFIVKHQKG